MTTTAEKIAVEFLQLNPALLAASPTNPRKTRSEDGMKDLVDSVTRIGVLQPVLARPMPSARKDAKDAQYELIYGHRRWSAAKTAKLTTIPVMVRDLKDDEVLEIQIVENLQREDVHHLEEAEGYAALMQQTKPGGKEKWTAEDIAQKVGKSRRHIYNRLKLLDLCEEARTAFYNGTIDSTKAYLLARIGHHETQQKALEDLFSKERHRELTTREAAVAIEQEFMLDLKSATFDIKVVDYIDPKGKPIAGACGPCPKRSGNAPDLFGDIKSANTCTDIVCHKAKTVAAAAREVELLKAKGVKIIDGKQAEGVFDAWSNRVNYSRKDYANEDARANFAGVVPDAYGKSLKTLLGKSLPTVMVLNPHTSRAQSVIDLPAAKKLLKEKGIIDAAPKKDKPATLGGASKQKDELDVIADRDAYALVRDQIAGALTDVDLREIARRFFNEVAFAASAFESAEWLCNLYKLPNAQTDSDAVFRAHIQAAPRESLSLLLLDIAQALQLSSGYTTPDDRKGFAALLKRYNVDRDAILKTLKDEAKAKAAAEKKAAAKPATKKPAVTKPAAKKK